MNIDLTKIWEYATKNFSGNLLFILIVLALIFLIIKYATQLSDSLGKLFSFFKKKKSTEITQADLEKHFLFTHIHYLNTVKINCLNFGDDARNYLIRLLLQHKLNHLERTTREFIRRPDLMELSSKDFEIALVNLIHNGLTAYIEDFKKEAHNLEEQEVVNVVVDVLWKNYNDQNDSSLKGFQEVINSPIYDNNLVRMHSLLLPMMVAIEAFLINSERSLSKLNGRLSNKTFHGFTFK